MKATAKILRTAFQSGDTFYEVLLTYTPNFIDKFFGKTTREEVHYVLYGASSCNPEILSWNRDEIDGSYWEICQVVQRDREDRYLRKEKERSAKKLSEVRKTFEEMTK